MKNIKKYWFLIVLLIIGFIFGIIFIYFINDLDKLVIKTEIKEYLKIIKTSKFSITNIFNSFFKYFIFLFIIWMSGFVFILLPINYFICFYKGFVIGFLLSCLINIYKLKGILMFLLFIFPSTIISIIITILLTFIISKISIKFLNILLNKDNYDLKKLIKKYFKILLCITIISIILSLFEIFINYKLIKLII